MFVDLPPATFMRVLSSQYLDAYVDGEFCASTSSFDGDSTHQRVDVGCSGSVVAFRNADGLVVAILPWENWHLTKLGVG